TRRPPPVSLAVGIATLREGFQTVRHQSSKRHPRETGRRRDIVPAAGEVNTVLGERIHEIFHDGVEGYDGREQGVEIPPPAGTAEPAVKNDRKQNQVLGQGEILVCWAVRLGLGGQVLPWNDEKQVQVQTPQQKQEEVNRSQALMVGCQLHMR